MAIRNEFDIQNKQQVTSTPVTSTVETAVTTKSLTPVPVGAKSNKQEDPVTKYINSEEFLAKSLDEQLVELQKQFPNVDKNQLSATLNAVKSTIEAEKKKADTATQTGEPKELSEGEKALIECENKLKQSGKQDVTIDDVISDIKQTPEDKRTEAQIKALEYYKGLKIEAKLQQVQTFVKKYGESLDKSIPEEVLQSEEWKKLNPQEKFEKRLDAIFKSTIPDYETKSDKEKEILRQSMLEKFGELTVSSKDEWIALSAEEKKVRLAMVAIATDVAESKGMKFSDIVDIYKNNPEKIKAAVADYAIQAVLTNADEQDMRTPEWVKKSGDEKFNDIVDIAAEALYPDFKSLSSKKKDEIKEAIKNRIGEEKYGKASWDKFTETEKSLKLQAMMSEISAMRYAGVTSYSEYKKFPISEQLRIMQEYETVAGIKIPDEEKIRRKVKAKLNKTEVTDEEVKSYLLSIPENKRTALQNVELSRIIIAEKEGQDSSKVNRKDYYESVEYIIDQVYGGDTKKFLQNELLKGRKIDQLKEEEIQSVLDSCSTFKGYLKTAKALGISKEKIKEKYPIKWQILLDAHSKATVSGDAKEAAKVEVHAWGRGVAQGAINKVRSSGAIELRRMANVFIEYNKNNAKVLSEHNTEGIKLMGAEYAENVAAATNTYCSPKVAETVHMTVACAKGIPDASMAAYSKSAIVTAHSDNDRYRFMQAMSRSDNAAVMEGLSAASNSVKDPSIRRLYDSYVDNVIQSYPPEQRARIIQARETGEISLYTLSQTTIEGSSSDSSQASNNKSEQGTSEVGETADRTQASQTPAVSGKGGTQGSVVSSPVGAVAPKAVPNAPVTGIANNSVQTSVDSVVSGKTPPTTTPQAISNVSSSSYTSSSSSEPMTDTEVEALTRKTEALLEKIETFIENQAESIEQRQVVKASETSGESVAASMSEDEIIEAITSSDIDAADLDKLNLSPEEKETLRKTITVIFENNSISAAYNKFVSKFGESAKMKFLEVFAANGDAASIRSFANDHKNDAKLISILYQYSQDSSLIAYLPKDEVFNLLMKGKITDLSKIDPNILADFIQERMKSEKNPRNLLGYLKLLPLEYQGAVLNQYPDLAQEVHGSDKWLEKNSKRNVNAKTSPTETPDTRVVMPGIEHPQKSKTAFVPDENLLDLNDYPTFEDGLALGSTIVPNPRGKNERYDKRKIKGHIYIKG